MAAEGGPNGPDPGGTLISGRFRPTKRLGSGSFGEIYMGVGTSGEKVAIKFEKAGLRCPQLRHEYKVYRELSGCLGIGRVHHYGTYGSSNVMVMDLLGASLEDLFTRCGRRFSLKTTLKLADQLLERVDAVHSRHLIHRDIKPANFVMGTDTSELCYCIDFGLSKRFRNPHTLAHIPHRVGKSLTGTPRYASINNHLGIEQARRDDLEAIGYVLIYFLKGRLPWQGLKARNASRKYKMIMEKKQSTSINTLCSGCPKEFAEYLSYCRSLKFEASPNIKYLRQLFRDLYTQQGYPVSTYGDADWDWNRISEGGAAQAPAASSAPGQASEGGEGPPAANARAPTNSKPYGMYGGQGAGSGGGDWGGGQSGSRPGSAANNTGYRPMTEATTGARAGSISDSRPDSAAPTGRYNGADASGTQLDSRGRSGQPGGSRPPSAGRPNSSAGAAPSGGRAEPNSGGADGSDPTGRAWASSGGGNNNGGRVPRPSSAHGARGTSSSAAAASGGGAPANAGNAAAGGDAYVVAGAKSMMTYRRSNGREDGQGSNGEAGGNGGGGSGAPNKSSARPRSAGVIGSRVAKPAQTGNMMGSAGSTGNGSGGVRSGSGGGTRQTSGRQYTSGAGAPPTFGQPSSSGRYRGSVG